MKIKKIYMLPYAVVGKYIYDPLIECLSPKLHCMAVELKGHGSRISEGSYKSIDEASDEIINIILKDACGEPFALYGHCVGGMIGYDVYKKLEAQGCNQLKRLFLGSQGTTDKLNVDFNTFAKDYLESNAAIIQSKNGESQGLTHLDDDFKIALFECIKPLLLKEFEIVKEYSKSKSFEVSNSMVFINGDSDTYVDTNFTKQLVGANNIKQHMVPGNHFFLADQSPLVAEIIRSNI